jgi:serine/threonine protein kinase
MPVSCHTEPTIREYRIARRLQARGNGGLFDQLLRLRGMPLGEGYTFGRLFAVGGEGAIYHVTSDAKPDAALVGKIPVVDWHRAVDLTSRIVKRARAIIDDEANLLETAGSPYLPRFEELLEFSNPLLEAERGGEFAEPEPCLVMERLGGQDLDVWLCRVHRGGELEEERLSLCLSRMAVELLRALADLDDRGFLYADLRPGNLRVIGRPLRRIRLLDAGSCVRHGEEGGRFPHVPSYLPPELFRASEQGEWIAASSAIQAAMAGRTLYELATGQAPRAAAPIDLEELSKAPIPASLVQVIAALAAEEITDCRDALEVLAP